MLYVMSIWDKLFEKQNMTNLTTRVWHTCVGFFSLFFKIRQIYNNVQANKAPTNGGLLLMAFVNNIQLTLFEIDDTSHMKMGLSAWSTK